MPGQVHRDVHLQGAHQFGDLPGAHLPAVDDPVEGGGDPLSKGAPVVRVQGDRDGLEPRLVVLLEETGRQVPDRVLAQVGRDVGQADPVVGVPSSRRVVLTGGGVLPVENLRAEEMFPRGIGDGQQGQRLADPLPRFDPLGNPRQESCQRVPPADVQQGKIQEPRGVFVIGVQPQQLLEDRDRLFVAIDLGQEDPLVAERELVGRVEPEQQVVGLHGLVAAAHLVQNGAAVHQGVDVAAVQLQGPIDAFQRLDVSLQRPQHHPAAAPGRRGSGVRLDCAVEIPERAQRVAGLRGDYPEGVQRDEIGRPGLEQLQEQALGLLHPPLFLQFQRLGLHLFYVHL